VNITALLYIRWADATGTLVGQGKPCRYGLYLTRARISEQVACLCPKNTPNGGLRRLISRHNINSNMTSCHLYVEIMINKDNL
jgi:hypothetical protein